MNEAKSTVPCQDDISELKSKEEAVDELVTERREVSNFDRITFEGPLKLTVTVGKPYSLTLKGSKSSTTSRQLSLTIRCGYTKK